MSPTAAIASYALFQFVNTHDASLLLVREFSSRDAARAWIAENGEKGKKYTLLEMYRP